MGADTTTEQTPSSRTEPLTPTSLADGVKVDLSPVDIWVLGQLIEAGAASFPPDVERDILNGYRILKGSGYEPPPTGGLPSVEIVATLEEADATKPDHQAHELLDATNGEPPDLPTVREVVLEEVPPANEASKHPALDALPDDVDASAPLAEPVQGEPQRPPKPAPQPVLDPEPLNRLADEVAQLREAVSTRPEPTHARAREENEAESAVADRVVDAALMSVALLVSSLFLATAAILSDAVLAILGTGLGLATAWLAHPYLMDREAS